MVQAERPLAAVESGDLRRVAVCRRGERRRVLSHVALALRGAGDDRGQPELLRALHPRGAVHVPAAAALAGRVDRIGRRGARLRADWLDRLVSVPGTRRQTVRLHHAAVAVARVGAGAARAPLDRLRAARVGDRAVPPRPFPARVLLAHRRGAVRALSHVRGVARQRGRGARAASRPRARGRPGRLRGRRDSDRAVLRVHPVLAPRARVPRIRGVYVIRYPVGPRP